MALPLDYQHQVRTECHPWPALLALPFAALILSVGVAVYSFFRMSGERLFEDGGEQYFREQFPFAIVIGLAAVGTVVGLFIVALVRRPHGLALLGVLLNLLWGGWWLSRLR